MAPASTASKNQKNASNNGTSHTPTPIKDLISMFDKMAIGKNTPEVNRQRPAPTKRRWLFGNIEKENTIPSTPAVNRDDQFNQLPMAKIDGESNGAAVNGESDHGIIGVETIRDGQYYEVEAAKERRRLEALCTEAELDLNNADMPDEAAESVRMAVGRVRLLLRKKFAKFEELIKIHLNPSPDDPRPTHLSDLDGYYDLVKIEIEDIDGCFDVVHRLKENNWKFSNGIDQKSDHRGPVVSNKPRPVQQKKTGNVRSEAAKQRFKEAKEAAMQRKKQMKSDCKNDQNLL